MLGLVVLSESLNGVWQNPAIPLLLIITGLKSTFIQPFLAILANSR